MHFYHGFDQVRRPDNFAEAIKPPPLSIDAQAAPTSLGGREVMHALLKRDTEMVSAS
jgi:hypothetical protein